MANEPERPIEKLLREAARKRRDSVGAPFELHPADRALLQGEVSRCFPQKPRRKFTAFFGTFWPRFAVCAVALFLLFIGVWSQWSPGPGEPNLVAKSESAPQALDALPELHRETISRPAAEPVSTAAPAPAEEAKDKLKVAGDVRQKRQPQVLEPYSSLKKEDGTAPITITVSESRAAAQKSREAAVSRSLNAPQPQPSPAGEPATAFGGGGGLLPEQSKTKATTELAGGGGAPAAGNVEPKASRPAEMGTFADSSSAEANLRMAPALQSAVEERVDADATANSQQFVRTIPALALAEPQPTAVPAVGVVMTSFKLEQSGPELRVIDRDGSVYRGSLQTSSGSAVRMESSDSIPNLSAMRRQAQPTGAAASSLRDNLPAARGYAFELTGTNRSLNEKVVFSGTLLPYPVQTNTNLAGAVSTLQTFSRTGGLPLLNTRILGRVRVGNNQPIDIQAVPFKPDERR